MLSNGRSQARQIEAVARGFGQGALHSPGNSPNGSGSPQTPTGHSQSHRTATGPAWTHSIGPPKPLDDSRSALREEKEKENGGVKKQGLLAAVRESRRESRANKRREELKRMIRVVPEAEGRSPVQEVREEEWL